MPPAILRICANCDWLRTENGRSFCFCHPPDLSPYHDPSADCAWLHPVVHPLDKGCSEFTKA